MLSLYGLPIEEMTYRHERRRKVAPFPALLDHSEANRDFDAGPSTITISRMNAGHEG